MLLQVVAATTRQNRFSGSVVAWVMARLGDHPGFDVELVDLRDHPLPFFDSPATPARTGRDYDDEAVARFGAVVDRADGYLICTGEYNHGYPAVLKNAMDSTFVEWRRKPVTFVAWGNVGGRARRRAAAPGGGRVRNGPSAPRRARAARCARRHPSVGAPRRPVALRPTRVTARHGRRRPGLVDGSAGGRPRR